jgi:hypothetical protein
LIPTVGQFCKKKVRITGTLVRTPGGACWLLLDFWECWQLLEQVSSILKLYKACHCILIIIKILVETLDSWTKSGARGIAYAAKHLRLS